MSFLAPFVLWGSLAAGIPVIIHFFFRSRFRTVPWAAMEFLLKSVEQTSRRLRFQELLLLIVRILLLLLLALALARPTTRAVSGAGDAVHAVFLIDNSLSMDAKDGPLTRLERAKAAARSVLDHLPAHSSAQVISFSDRSTLLGPRRSSDLERGRSLIDEVQPTGRGTDLAIGMKTAIEAMRNSDAPQRELYIFSDAQTRSFDTQPATIAELAKAAKELGTVYFCRGSSKNIRNATVLGIGPQTGIPHTGARMGFAILVKNTGQESLRDLTVSLITDSDEKTRETQPLPRLEPGASRSITLSGRWNEPGLRTVSATVHSDDLAIDNRADQVVRVRDKVRVLVIDGRPSSREPEKASSFFLMHALLPIKEGDRSRYFLQPRLISPAQAIPAHLIDQDLCILSDVALERDASKPGEVLPPDFIEALDRFVRDGKPLLIFAGERTDPASYNRALLERRPLLPLKLTGVRKRPERSEVGLDRNSATDSALSRFRDDETYQTFNQVKTRVSLDGEELPAESDRPASRVLLRFTDGRPAIVLRPAGAGTVALVTTSADLTCNDMPLWVNVYVPLIDALVAHLLLAETSAHNTTTGAGIKWFAPAADAERNFTLIRPDGVRVRLPSPEPILGRPRVNAPDTPMPGIYKLQMVDSHDVGGMPFAVAADHDEAVQTDVLSNDRINERFGFAPVHLQVTDDLTPFQGGERAKREWTPKLLWVVLIMALSESLLAYWVGKPR